MKIGIITFHFPFNYGAALQAYAMQAHLSNMGHEAYIIDYAPEYHTKQYSRGRTWKSCFHPPFWQSPIRVFFKLFDDLDKKRAANFDRFSNKYFSLYPFSEDSDFSEFDCILLGSDQIWSQEHTNNRFDGPYYGDGFKCRVFSYAASNRTTSLNDFEKETYTSKLKQLSHIGVREQILKDLLQPLTEKKIVLTVDPTILAGQEVFCPIQLNRQIEGKYVLLYQIPYYPEIFKMAKKYADSINAKLISLVDRPNPRYRKCADLTAGPEEFLSYFKYAECVFTTSFHGTAFSIIYNKDFYSIKQNTSADIRIDSILGQLGLRERFIDISDQPAVKHINYELVTPIVREIRKSSENFLLAAINNVPL